MTPDQLRKLSEIAGIEIVDNRFGLWLKDDPLEAFEPHKSDQQFLKDAYAPKYFALEESVADGLKILESDQYLDPAKIDLAVRIIKGGLS